MNGNLWEITGSIMVWGALVLFLEYLFYPVVRDLKQKYQLSQHMYWLCAFQAKILCNVKDYDKSVTVIQKSYRERSDRCDI